MTGLIDTIISATTPGVVDKIAGALGTSSGVSGDALRGAIPAALAAMLKLNDAGHSSTLLDLIQGVLRGGNPLDDPNRLADAATGNEHSLVDTLFGSSLGPVAAALGSQFGLGEDTVKKLLGAASLLGIGGIGRHLGANPTAQQLTGLLQNERPSILSALPGGLSSLLGLAGAGAAAGAASTASAAPPRYDDEPVAASSGGMGKWLPWLLAALVALAVIFGIKSCSSHDDTAPPPSDVTGTAADTTATDTTGTVPPATPAATTAPAATAPSVVPVGAGVTAETRNNLPALNVYFDVGKSEVSKDLAKVSAPLKTYVDANAGTVLTVSGFNDPTGNAAANAELSKKRAQQVAAALEATGIPKASIKLEKPAATSGTGDTNAESRRVEVTIKK